jgi:hypothetical protein
LYVVYLPAGTGKAGIRLDTAGNYSVKWFNPREGGEMQDGSVTSLSGGGLRNPGAPPATSMPMEEDWVMVLTL